MTSRGAKTALTTSKLQFGGAKQGAIVGRHGAARSRMKRLAYWFYLASDDTEPYRTTVGASFASRESFRDLAACVSTVLDDGLARYHTACAAARQAFQRDAAAGYPLGIRVAGRA